MSRIKLTDSERLILANQYEILGHLKDDDTYLELADNLRDGHKWLYEQYIAVERNLDEDVVEFVLDILQIYDFIRISYADLADKSGIDQNNVVFPGFDGNNESELLNFTRALSRNGNYEELIGKNARNSHMPTVDMYRRIIAEWVAIGKPSYPLSKGQIQSLLTARIHPDNRGKK